MSDQSWRIKAACLGHPQPEWFFPLPTDTWAKQAAQKVCATCPVKTECRDEGRRTNSEGIWGGDIYYQPHNTPTGHP